MSTDPTPQATPATEEEWPDISQWPVILQQDDCAPDALEYFEKEFPLNTGMDLYDFLKTARCRISEMDTEWLLNDMHLSRSADDPFWTLRRKPQDPTPQATPSVATTSIIVASGLAPVRFTTGPHALRLARKNGELILQGLMMWREGRDGGEYWETFPTIDLTDEESES